MSNETSANDNQASTYDDNFVNTVMCVWEALLEEEYAESSEDKSVYSLMRERVGVMAMRQLVIDVLAPAVEKGWDSVGEDYESCFDFEFVPDFLHYAAPLMRVTNNLRLSDKEIHDVAAKTLEDSINRTKAFL